MSFTVAIVGRPNVGKSTLFNRLVGRRLALVDDRPGVTRDRRPGAGQLGDLDFTVIDTAGLEEAPAESLAGRMRAQTETAIAQADAIFFVIDARAGLTPVDRAFAAEVRRSGKPVVVVANKSEGRAGEAGRLEAFGLGLGDPIAISAEHAEGMADLHEALVEALPEHVQAQRDERRRAREDLGQESDEQSGDLDEAALAAARLRHPIRVAVIGRPNAGKSTLINRLLGEDRLLTGPEAGITRDSITVDIQWNGRTFRFDDTAGMRRRSRVDDKLEKLSVADGLNAVRFAEVVVVLFDTERGIEEQDQRIADLAEREGRAVVLAAGKWDLADNKPGAISKLRQEAERKLTQLKGAPFVAVSGLTGEGIDRLMQAILDAFEIWNKRVPTSALNRWLIASTSAHPPPAVSGRRIKLNYMTQPKARPPSFVLFCSRADAVPDAYKRYLVNSLRDTFELPGTPIRLTLREKANPFEKKKRR
ncbi:MAG TPA: ribosome biogenesis GTPase Der [Pseudolabrys sp.]|nr:ribosome biogenesis GTPase Der [Pseudolabrys sp.]